MERTHGEKVSPVKREVIIRHLANLALFTGYWHGHFFWKGIPKPNLGKTKHIPLIAQKA
jgi:hypothetical protein